MFANPARALRNSPMHLATKKLPISPKNDSDNGSVGRLPVIGVKPVVLAPVAKANALILSPKNINFTTTKDKLFMQNMAKNIRSMDQNR